MSSDRDRSNLHAAFDRSIAEAARIAAEADADPSDPHNRVIHDFSAAVGLTERLLTDLEAVSGPSGYLEEARNHAYKVLELVGQHLTDPPGSRG